MSVRHSSLNLNKTPPSVSENFTTLVDDAFLQIALREKRSFAKRKRKRKKKERETLLPTITKIIQSMLFTESFKMDETPQSRTVALC